MAYKRISPIPIAEGGTNTTSLATTDGVVYYDGTKLVTTAVGSATQVLTSNGAGVAPTFQAVSGSYVGLPYTEVTGTSATMSANNGYIPNNAALVTLTLPTTAALGTRIEIAGKGAGAWKVAQNAGQQIFFGSAASTVGVGGSFQTNTANVCATLICITANTTWDVLSAGTNTFAVLTVT